MMAWPTHRLFMSFLFHFFLRPQRKLPPTASHGLRSWQSEFFQDQAVDLQELANVFTIEIQNRPCRSSNTKGFGSLQIASRVPLLVKDPVTEAAMETQSLPNDVHTLRLDMNPQEVRHIACNLKSRHFKGQQPDAFIIIPGKDSNMLIETHWSAWTYTNPLFSSRRKGMSWCVWTTFIFNLHKLTL